MEDRDELKTYQSVKVSPVYVETYLLSLVNSELRRSSRLANKPAPSYKETQSREGNKDWGNPEATITRTEGDVTGEQETSEVTP